MQTLKNRDHRARLCFCHWFQNFLEGEEEDVLHVTFFSDQAWFQLCFVNENPNTLHEIELALLAQCSLTELSMPIDIYQENILMPFFYELGENKLNRGWLQQDGATAHTAMSTTIFSDGIFADRITSRGVWPAQSPDLNPLDFFLWGYLQSIMYEGNYKTLEELKEAIPTTIPSKIST